MYGSEMINVTGVDITKLVCAVYDLSQPQGMGMLHFKPGPLPIEDAEDIIKRGEKSNYSDGSLTPIIYMDYVMGRSCKFTLYRDKDGGLFIKKYWYDHTEEQLHTLLQKVGIANV